MQLRNLSYIWCYICTAKSSVLNFLLASVSNLLSYLFLMRQGQESSFWFVCLQSSLFSVSLSLFSFQKKYHPTGVKSHFLVQEEETWMLCQPWQNNGIEPKQNGNWCPQGDQWQLKTQWIWINQNKHLDLSTCEERKRIIQMTQAVTFFSLYLEVT